MTGAPQFKGRRNSSYEEILDGRLHRVAVEHGEQPLFDTGELGLE